MEWVGPPLLAVGSCLEVDLLQRESGTTQMITIGYNLVLAIVTGMTIAGISRARGLQPVALLGVHLFVAWCLASMFGENLFGVMRLFAYAGFLHVPVVLGFWSMRLRKTSPRAAIAIGMLGLGILFIATDAFLVEPQWLEITRVNLQHPKLTRHVRIVVLSDLQYDAFGDYERNAFRRALEQHPDVILMPGDYIQVGGEKRTRMVAQTNQFLREINFSAPLGVYAVGGNIDPANWPEIFRGLPITVFRSMEQVTIADVAITGLPYEKSDRIDTSVPRADAFHIVLGHSPNFALGDIQADLLIAGHTHGGQVRLPLLGPLLTFSAVPNRWASGLTTLAGGSILVVSRGVGLERGYAPRLRFLCRPEIVVIDVWPS